MRHGAASRRSRSRGNGGNSGNRRGAPNRTQVFDSNGPDVRIRGTAHQVHEKYMALAKDAAAAGDHVMAESYLQHAEHYQRVINGWQEDLREIAEEGHQETQNSRFEKGSDKKQFSEKQKSSSSDSPSGEDLGLPESLIGKREKELADA